MMIVLLYCFKKSISSFLPLRPARSEPLAVVFAMSKLCVCFNSFNIIGWIDAGILVLCRKSAPDAAFSYISSPICHFPDLTTE